MKLSISFFSFSSSLLFFLLFHGVNCDGIIEDTCKKAVTMDPKLNYDFCVTSVQADSNSHNADLVGLGLISINLVVANTTYIESYIEKLLNEGGDEKTEKYLQNCDDLYSDFATTLNESIDLFNAGDYNGANILLSSGIDTASGCENGFKEDQGLSSPLTKENDDITQLTRIGLTITNMIEG